MINFDEFYGNENIKKILISNPDCQVWLIEGESGSGRHTLARLIAGKALCEQIDNKPCGVCRSCLKLKNDSHLDVIKINYDIKISELRSVLENVYVYPSEGNKKIYLIDHAENFTVQQQNLLLKIIEEPPEFVIFILICFSAENLLPTVRSRCVTLSLKPLKNDLLKKILKDSFPQLDSTDINNAVMLSDGFLGRAINLKEANLENVYSDCNLIMENLASKNYYQALKILHSGKEQRDKFILKIQILSQCFRKKLFISSGMLETNTNSNIAEDHRIGCSELSRLCYLFDEILSRKELNINISIWSVYVIEQCRKILQ